MVSKSNPLVKPYLKWAGGKRQLLPELKKYTSGYKIKTYYEPFIGAGALFFDLQPKRAVINDVNTELIYTYCSIKDNIDELIELLKIYETKNNSDDYYEIRKKDREYSYCNWSECEKAARLIYLNKTCYNGLYRVNSQGLFNTPFGAYKRPAIVNEMVLRSVSDYLQNMDSIKITNVDFQYAVEDAEKGDLVYFDPPYHSSNNTNFTGYAKGGFDESEQIRLFKVYKDLSNKNIKCILSNSATNFIKDLYSEFNVHVVKANRAINSNASDRGAVDEVIVTNWD